MLKAANLAGQAINITRTTAAHAMCYKFTSLFSIPHGHAVMLCLPEVWQYMQEHLDDCRDQRGAGYLSDTLKHLSHCFGKRNPLEAIDFIKELRIHLDFSIPPGITDEQIEVMTNSVNEQRLGNFPVVLQHENIKELYKQIIRGRK
jgi:alcohol dehydrogenase class IV